MALLNVLPAHTDKTLQTFPTSLVLLNSAYFFSSLLVLLCYKRTIWCRIVLWAEHSAPGPQEERFAAYIEGLAEAAGHADRNVPLKNYCTGLLLPGERKSVEPMAARLAPDNVRRMHQSLHHVVADAPWSDEAVLDRCLDFVLAGHAASGAGGGVGGG